MVDSDKVGLWGGECTCPDGEVYLVGDNLDLCGSLACAGGEETGHPKKCVHVRATTEHSLGVGRLGRPILCNLGLCLQGHTHICH